MSGLAVVRSIGSARSLRSLEELEDFEQELVDQYCLAMLGAGLSDAHVSEDRRILFELIEFLAVPVWATTPEDADRWLHWLRRQRRQARSTVQGKAWAVAQFFEFLLVRYQADIHALTGCVVMQPIDESTGRRRPTTPRRVSRPRRRRSMRCSARGGTRFRSLAST